MLYDFARQIVRDISQKKLLSALAQFRGDYRLIRRVVCMTGIFVKLYHAHEPFGGR
jgi:hypothetical protein